MPHDYAADVFAQLSQSLSSSDHASPIDIDMDTVDIEPVKWLWWPYLASGTIALLDGDPGVGKSLLTLQLAATLSRGFPLPDQQGKPTLPTTAAPVVLLSTEDSLASTVKPRLLAANADTSKIFVLTGWVSAEDPEQQAFDFQHLPILDAELQHRHPALVIIDPIQAYLGKIDMHRSNETRPLLAALADMARRHTCCILCIRHPAKTAQGGKAMHRGLGSIDFVGAARTALFVDDHPLKHAVLLCQSKNNFALHGRTQIFDKKDGMFQWAGVTRVTAEDIAGGMRGPEPTELLRAMLWLERHLASGIAQPSKDVEMQAEEAGIGRKTLMRARRQLEVRARQVTGGGWEIRLTEMTVISPPTTT